MSGIVHTNGIENYWSLLKRSIKGTQIHVSHDHLHRYVNERTFAFNHRQDGELGRMRAAMAGAAGRRLTWATLTDPTAHLVARPWRPAQEAIHHIRPGGCV